MQTFFGGAAAYVNGRIFMSLTPVGLALKLPEEDRILLINEGAKRLQYFPKAPIKKDYVVLTEALADDPPALDTWITKSTAFAGK